MCTNCIFENNAKPLNFQNVLNFRIASCYYLLTVTVQLPETRYASKKTADLYETSIV